MVGAYHRLYQIEASFACPSTTWPPGRSTTNKRESIDAHLTVVFGAFAAGRLVEERTGWSIRRFVRTARRYRTVQIRASQQLITAADPLPDDLRGAFTKIHRAHTGARN